MATDTWTQALYATPPVMCGLRLRPYSLAHSVLLRATENPYAYIGVEASRADLLSAVMICSRTMEQNKAALFGGGQKIGALLWFSFKWRRMDIATADASFRTYLSDFTGSAPRQPSEGNREENPVPDEYCLHRILCLKYHMDASAAWDCSYGLARAYYDAWVDFEGNKGLMTPTQVVLAEMELKMKTATDSGDKAEADRIWAEMGAILAKQNQGAA